MSHREYVEADLLQAIAALYDAAVEPSLWPRVLDICREFVGGSSAAIFAKDVTGTRRQLVHVDGRLDPAFTRLYFAELAPIDPSNPAQVYAPIEQGVITSQKLDPREFSQTRFAAEWAAPQGIVDIGFTALERRGDWAALFGVFRHERDGLGDAAMAQRISALAPHLRRAISIANVVGDIAQETYALRQAIDRLTIAVVLVDADGRIVHANQAGALMIGLVKADSSPALGFVRLDRSLGRQLAMLGSQVSSTTFLETSSGERLIAHALPLNAGNRFFTDLGSRDAAAAIFLQPTRFELPTAFESLAEEFQLTPAELRVAVATVVHGKVADLAENLGISEATAKTHLSRIFAKTDTKRQADIVKLIAAFKSPLIAS